MWIHRCRLQLHDNLFYETRAAGRLYETSPYLHNYALTYALGFVRDVDEEGNETIGSPYFVSERVPRYATDLKPLTRDDNYVYVLPASPFAVTFTFHTFKYGNNHYHDLSTISNDQKKAMGLKGNSNLPTFGRAKELAVGSILEFIILAQTDISYRIPRWIRMGLWLSKVACQCIEAHELVERRGPYLAAGPLNPLDVPAGVLRAFDIVSMPPSSLVANARCGGDYYEVERGLGLPVGLRYTFP